MVRFMSPNDDDDSTIIQFASIVLPPTTNTFQNYTKRVFIRLFCNTKYLVDFVYLYHLFMGWI